MGLCKLSDDHPGEKHAKILRANSRFMGLGA